MFSGILKIYELSLVKLQTLILIDEFYIGPFPTFQGLVPSQPAVAVAWSQPEAMSVITDYGHMISGS